jgi:hypothetical protein
MRIRRQKFIDNEAGMATIVVISLLSIILIFVAANLRTLYILRTDLRFIEQQQTNRLAKMGPLTNAPPPTETIPRAAEGASPANRPR